MFARPLLGLLALVVLPFAFTGCGGGHGDADKGKKPPGVKFVKPVERPVPFYAYFTGRTAAKDEVEVRARVTGYIDDIKFEPGQLVKKDKVLFEIDPRPYKADLDRAEAQVALAEAQYNLAAANLARERELAVTKSTSPRELDVHVAKMKEADAQSKAAKAAKEMADLNYSFTKVTSPIDGIVSRNLLTKGNIVSADKTLLTTVVSEDPMYAYFDVDENTMLRVQKMIQAGLMKATSETEVPVELSLANEGDEFPHKGTIDFINPSVSTTTGTLQVRGTFKNPKVGKAEKRILRPGLFVRVRLQLGAERPSLLVPQTAIVTELGNKVLMVVDKDNKIERRPVTLGPIQSDGLQVVEPEMVVRTEAGLRAAKEGEKGEPSLTGSDRVVVSGLQRIRPGMVVNAAAADGKEK